jgi:hypothetical protein
MKTVPAFLVYAVVVGEAFDIVVIVVGKNAVLAFFILPIELEAALAMGFNLK